MYIVHIRKQRMQKIFTDITKNFIHYEQIPIGKFFIHTLRTDVTV